MWVSVAQHDQNNHFLTWPEQGYVFSRFQPFVTSKVLSSCSHLFRMIKIPRVDIGKMYRIVGNKRWFTLHLYLKNYEEYCRQLARHKFSFFLILLWSLRDLNCYCEWLNLQKYDFLQNVNLIIITASYLLWPLDHPFWKNLKLNCH